MSISYIPIHGFGVMTKPSCETTSICEDSRVKLRGIVSTNAILLSLFVPVLCKRSSTSTMSPVCKNSGDKSINFFSIVSPCVSAYSLRRNEDVRECPYEVLKLI